MKTPEAQHDDSTTAAAAAPAPTKNPNEEVIDLDTRSSAASRRSSR